MLEQVPPLITACKARSKTPQGSKTVENAPPKSPKESGSSRSPSRTRKRRAYGEPLGPVQQARVRGVREVANSLIALLDLGGLGGGGRRFARDSALDCPWRKSRRLEGTSYRDTRDRGWRMIPRPLRLWDFERMLAGEDRLFVDRVERSRLLILDVDLHGEADREWVLAQPQGPENTNRARSEFRRRWMAEWSHSVVEAAKGVLDEEDVVTLSSRGGYHVILWLDEALPVAELATLASRWKRAVVARTGSLPAGLAIDAFPKLESDGTGRFCALPLSKGQRVVGLDLAKPVYRKRLEDGRRVGSMGLSAVRDVRAQLEAILGPEGHEEVRIIEGGGGSEGWASGVLGQLRKSDFVEECLRIVADGFGVGESADVAPRLLFALSAAGMRPPLALRAYEAFVRRPGHGANHCRSERGRRALMASARTQLRRFERGTQMKRPDGSPLTWYGGMKSDELRKELWGLVEQEAPAWRRPGLAAARAPTTEIERFMA